MDTELTVAMVLIAFATGILLAIIANDRGRKK